MTQPYSHIYMYTSQHHTRDFPSNTFTGKSHHISRSVIPPLHTRLCSLIATSSPMKSHLLFVLHTQLNFNTLLIKRHTVCGIEKQNTNSSPHRVRRTRPCIELAKSACFQSTFFLAPCTAQLTQGHIILFPSLLLTSFQHTLCTYTHAYIYPHVHIHMQQCVLC